MRRRIWIGALLLVGLVTAAYAGPRAARVYARAVRGAPDVEPEKRDAFFIWTDGEGFHVRWTNAGEPTLFAGRIDTDRPLRDLERVYEHGAGFVKAYGGRIVMFSSTSRGTTDGFDVQIPGGRKLQLELTIDGEEPDTEQVRFGAEGAQPDGFPMLVFLR